MARRCSIHSTKRSRLRPYVASRQTVPWRVVWEHLLARCEGAELSIIVELILVIHLSELLKVDLVPQNGTDPSEPLHELIALA